MTIASQLAALGISTSPRPARPLLAHGDYREVFADLDECQAVIADPPYGDRTHKGHDNGANLANRKTSIVKANGVADTMRERRAISYDRWTRDDVVEFVEFWRPRNVGWWAVMSCSDLSPIWREEYERAGLYAFHPIPCVITGMTVRMSGDGPSSWAVYLNIARPRSSDFVGKKKPRGGTRPGAYVGGRGLKDRTESHIGGKPLWLMEKIVEDYTLPGDLVVDPCAGYATTGLASLKLGRRFAGAEVDETTYSAGLGRLEATKK